jgi:hypothetical protein
MSEAEREEGNETLVLSQWLTMLASKGSTANFGVEWEMLAGVWQNFVM